MVLILLRISNCSNLLTTLFWTVQKAPDKGWRAPWSKRCDYHNRDEENNPNVNNVNNDNPIIWEIHFWLILGTNFTFVSNHFFHFFCVVLILVQLFIAFLLFNWCLVEQRNSLAGKSHLQTRIFIFIYVIPC